MRIDLAPGTVLSSAYRTGELLGRGGMGSVYSTLPLHDALPISLKVLLADAATDPTVVARFEREAYTASRLGHPNIVRVFDFRRMPGEPVYLVMELLEGHSTLLAGRIAWSRSFGSRMFASRIARS